MRTRTSTPNGVALGARPDPIRTSHFDSDPDSSGDVRVRTQTRAGSMTAQPTHNFVLLVYNGASQAAQSARSSVSRCHDGADSHSLYTPSLNWWSYGCEPGRSVPFCRITRNWATSAIVRNRPRAKCRYRPRATDRDRLRAKHPEVRRKIRGRHAVFVHGTHYVPTQYVRSRHRNHHQRIP
jgi:hypothetical protein